MKAIVQDTYGSPDIVELRAMDKPVVKDDEVLVRVRAAAVNIADWRPARDVRPRRGLRPRSLVWARSSGQGAFAVAVRAPADAGVRREAQTGRTWLF